MPRLTLGFLPILLAAWLTLASFIWIVSKRPPESDPISRGRRIYAEEGCVHCHSQYVRPDESDRERWGVGRPGNTALIGNRRQGPDLATVGGRLPEASLRLHLTAPNKYMPGTTMPDYSHLFAPGDQRGEDLIAYLLSLQPKK